MGTILNFRLQQLQRLKQSEVKSVARQHRARKIRYDNSRLPLAAFTSVLSPHFFPLVLRGQNQFSSGQRGPSMLWPRGVRACMGWGDKGKQADPVQRKRPYGRVGKGADKSMRNPIKCYKPISRMADATPRRN